MKQTIRFALAIAASAAAMFAYVYEAPPEKMLQEVALEGTSDTTFTSQAAVPQQSAAQTESRERELAAKELADIDPASIDWESVSQRGSLPGLDLMLHRANGEERYSATEIAAFNKLHVLPFNPLKQKVCYEEEAEHTASGLITVCDDTIRERPEHRYASMDFDDLFELAEADPAAAVFASRNAAKVNDRVGMALRAAALSGKPGPILYSAAKEFSSPGIKFTEDNKRTAVEGVVPATVFNRMVLESVAQNMGDPRVKPRAWLKYVDDFVKTPSERAEFLEAVDQAARHAMEGMAQIQQEITGNTQLRELLDA